MYGLNMGRKKKDIDWSNVDKMLRAGCTGTEVAASLGIHANTLYLACQTENKCDFSEYSAEKKAIGYKMLKLARLETALNGNTTMQIWLSKQWLGERDKTDMDISGKIDMDITKLTNEQLNALLARSLAKGSDSQE
jgi:hypothetical protein